MQRKPTAKGEKKAVKTREQLKKTRIGKNETEVKARMKRRALEPPTNVSHPEKKSKP